VARRFIPGILHNTVAVAIIACTVIPWGQIGPYPEALGLRHQMLDQQRGGAHFNQRRHAALDSSSMILSVAPTSASSAGIGKEAP
jgi:hypothetical protein